jgi:Mn2+/Fe2+ NRAMP family transporter
MTIPFFAYPIAAVLAHPHWTSVGRAIVAPHVQTSPSYVLLFVATAGTTITPFMQLYLQSAVVERGLGPDDLNHERAEVVTGSVFANLVASFIIVATGATLFVHGHRVVDTASQAAQALAPFAGRFAEVLFAVGLLGASLLAAAVLPVTAAFVISETFGFERGVSRSPREAPVFVGVVTTLVVVGAVVAMIPGVPVFRLLVGVQAVNGVLLPVTLWFVWRLSASAEVMGRYRNGRAFNAVAGVTVAATSALSLILLAVTVGVP